MREREREREEKSRFWKWKLKHNNKGYYHTTTITTAPTPRCFYKAFRTLGKFNNLSRLSKRHCILHHITSSDDGDTEAACSYFPCTTKSFDSLSLFVFVFSSMHALCMCAYTRFKGVLMDPLHCSIIPSIFFHPFSLSSLFSFTLLLYLICHNHLSILEEEVRDA